MNFTLKVTLLFIVISDFSWCQNKLDNYFFKNSLKIDSNISNDKIKDLALLNYQAIFFGEDHNSKDIAYYESLIMNVFRNRTHKLFIEFPVGYNFTVEEFLNRLPIDTTKIDFEFFSGGDKNQEIILRYIYNENLKKHDSLKIKLFHIDVIDVKFVNIDDLLWFFKKKNKPKEVRMGFRQLKKIKDDHILNEDSLTIQYILLLDIFYTNLQIYKSYFKEFFPEFKKDMDGIYAYSVARKEDSICACRSNSREEFMLQNIMDQLKGDSSKNFISINGASHIPLNIQSDFELLKSWEPLAARFKKRNPDIKTCSIYFMDKVIDSFGEEYFPKEKQLILDYVNQGGTYLIRLDGENTPFKELSQKFQYIVVW